MRLRDARDRPDLGVLDPVGRRVLPHMGPSGRRAGSAAGGGPVKSHFREQGLMLERVASLQSSRMAFGPMIGAMANLPLDRPAEPSLQLVIRAKAGDQMAMELLCSRYLRRLQAWAHGRLPAWARGAADTQDLAQETLSRVVQKLAAFEPKHDGAFEGYVFRAMINRVLDEIRKAQRRPQGDPLDPQRSSADPSPFELAVGTELRAR